jgi:hypothetical protein
MLFLRENISMELNQWDESPAALVVRELESELRACLRHELFEKLLPVALKNYDYSVIWQQWVAAKQVLFQVLYVAMDLLFSHDLTLLCAADMGGGFQLGQNFASFEAHLQVGLKELFIHFRAVQKVSSNRYQLMQFE